jgi:hypothetical protein
MALLDLEWLMGINSSRVKKDPSILSPNTLHFIEKSEAIILFQRQGRRKILKDRQAFLLLHLQ